jgi:DNA polymerase II large subunit
VESYFQAIERAVDEAYSVAERARQEGLDPEVTPEIPRAQDMAMRVEKLLVHLHLTGISEEIRELAERLPREEVAVTIARRLAQDERRGTNLEARLDAALRVGLAILTEGILVAPLEGLAEVHVKSGSDGSYLELFYAGPIRAAGGTAQALSVLLADVVRRDAGLGVFHPEPAEVERYKEEVPLYKQRQHLQYSPSPEEIELAVRHIPVCISGESTEGDVEVSAFRNLPRVETNGLRGGAVLVLAEGICQKAPKLAKIVDKLKLPGWEFLRDLGRGHAVETEEAHSPKYLAEALGGRPILAHPHHPGGFRLRYGRARTTGLAACAVNPATMVILRRFLAIGTQLKVEYPGKAAAMGLCDAIEGPIVELDDGTITAVHERERAQELLPHIVRILDLGELLVSFGEFLENNRALVPDGYSAPWHLEELRAAGAPLESLPTSPTYAEALDTSRRYGVPLHPKFSLFWHDLSSGELRALSEFVEANGRWRDEALTLPVDPEHAERLRRLGFLSQPYRENRILGEPESSAALVGGLGLAVSEGSLVRISPLDPVEPEPLPYVSRLAGVTIRARAPSRIGARVGRPEKARQRSMTPNVHTLFPVGQAGGPKRSVSEAVRRTMGGGVPVQLGRRVCPSCGRSTVWPKCRCGSHTNATEEVVTEPLPIAPIWSEAVRRLNLRKTPEVKGVKGLTSPGKVPEVLDKGILRAYHGISVYQDGTARFDLTDLPLTHFRLREIGLSIERARGLGYTKDWAGEPLERTDQLVELAPQDLVVSRSCGEYLTHLAQFVDDELVHIYGLPPFYEAKRPEDLIGAIVVALAPHTSGGVAGRIIGFTEAEACFAHPIFHAAKRRNCDGDEDSVTLLVDALLNFSRAYLPSSRGALMDKPLVLTTRLNPTEVDKEAHNVDVASRYPLALYRAAQEGKSAKEVESLIDTIGHRVTRQEGIDGCGFTHDTADIAGGPVRSAYREAESMNGIVTQSLELTSQIRAVDVAGAVTLMLNSHFLPDLMGNLKSYATQTFRCKSCGTSYRRPPLRGRCTQSNARGGRCDGELLPTVYERMVRKYLGLSQQLSETVGVTPYVRQRIDILAASLATMFPGTPSQKTLETFDAPSDGTDSSELS